MHYSVSVVIPTFNSCAVIRQSVASALTQTHPCEVIVVDDGSTDATALQLASVASRITYVRQSNQGVSAARNTGIRRATGEWIAFLDADDLWHPQKVEVQLTALRGVFDSSAIGMIGSRAVEKMPSTLSFEPPVRWLQVRDFLLGVPVSPSGVLIRRSCLEQTGGFDCQFGPAADRDMWLRIVSNYDVLEVKSPCWWYRIHEAQMSQEPIKMNQEFRRVLEKYFREHPEHLHQRHLAYSYLHLDAALAHLEIQQPVRAAARMIRSFIRHPHSLRDPRHSRGRRLKIMIKICLEFWRTGLLNVDALIRRGSQNNVMDS